MKRKITVQEGRQKVQFVAVMTGIVSAFATLLTNWTPDTRFLVAAGATAVSAVTTAAVLSWRNY